MVTTPKLKTDLSELLTVGPLVEGVFYKILKIENPLFLHNNNESCGFSPKIGEMMALRYSFKAADDWGGGYEHLLLFIKRSPSNYCRYFDSISYLEKSISGVTFELDKEYAKQQIMKLQQEIDQYKQDYQLNT